MIHALHCGSHIIQHPEDGPVNAADPPLSYFKGKPYVLGSLGEGKAAIFDKNPIYRTDTFDCETYVSTVLALVVSDDGLVRKAHGRHYSHGLFRGRSGCRCLPGRKFWYRITGRSC